MKNDLPQQNQIDNDLHVSVLQFDPVWEDKLGNLTTIKNFAHSCASQTQLIVLPEMATTGFTMNAADVAEDMEGHTVKFLVDLAKETQIAICGSFVIKEMAAFYNRFIFFHPNGKVEKYDKKHLFTMASEHGSYKPGSERKLIEYKGWKILPVICYDIRFPVWCRNNLNYDILLCVANWPDKRTFIWDTLLKARALENQSYVIGCNRIGTDKNSVGYDGNSVVIDAKGTALTKTSNQAQELNVALNRKTLIDFRTAFPVLKDADGFQII